MAQIGQHTGLDEDDTRLAPGDVIDASTKSSVRLAAAG